MRLTRTVQTLLVVSILAGSSASAIAQDLDDIESFHEDATVIGDYTQQSVTFVGFDTYSAGEPVEVVFGQAREPVNGEGEGELIFGEAALKTPVPLDEFHAHRESGEPMVLECDRVVVMAVRDEKMLVGEGCAVIEP